MSPGILLPEDAVMEDAPAPSSDQDKQDSSPNPLPVGDAPSESSDKENRKGTLEDMFDEDTDDDEFMSSLAQAEKEADSQDQPYVYNAMGEDESGIDRKHSAFTPLARFSDPEVMRAFYQRLFPFRYLFQWLNHSISPSNDFAHREFAFTLPNDAYLRYQSFPSADL
jgi:DNA primase small subunit